MLLTVEWKDELKTDNIRTTLENKVRVDTEKSNKDYGGTVVSEGSMCRVCCGPD